MSTHYWVGCELGSRRVTLSKLAEADQSSRCGSGTQKRETIWSPADNILLRLVPPRGFEPLSRA